jgi:hypothetical protein
VEASNFTALEIAWMSCLPDRSVNVTKTAAVDPDFPEIVRFTLTIQNLANNTRVARVVDTLPIGMKLLDSSQVPSSYENDVVTWNVIDLDPMETVEIVYRTSVLYSGTFVNSAQIEFRAVDGPIESSAYANAVVTVGDFEGERTLSGWQPPDWGFSYTDYRNDLTCGEICDLGT